jgi:hypothetical protein
MSDKDGISTIDDALPAKRKLSLQQLGQIIKEVIPQSQNTFNTACLTLNETDKFLPFLLK